MARRGELAGTELATLEIAWSDEAGRDPETRAEIEGLGWLYGVGMAQRAALATLDGVGTLEAPTKPQDESTPTLAGAATLTATGAAAAWATAQITATSALEGVGARYAWTRTDQDLGGWADVQALGVGGVAPAIDLSGAATLTAAGAATTWVRPSLGGEADVQALAVLAGSRLVELGGQGDMWSSAAVRYQTLPIGVRGVIRPPENRSVTR